MRRLRSLIPILLFLVSCGVAWAEGPFEDCGRYRLFGNLERDGAHSFLVVFPGSLSETRLKISPRALDPDSLEAFKTLSAYIGRRVMLQGEIRTRIEAYRGTIVIKSVVPTLPVGFQGPASDEYHLVEKLSCDP